MSKDLTPFDCDSTVITVEGFPLDERQSKFDTEEILVLLNFDVIKEEAFWKTIGEIEL